MKDNGRSGHPKTHQTYKHEEKVQLVRFNRRRTILITDLEMKQTSEMVPRILTDERKSSSGLSFHLNIRLIRIFLTE